MMSFGTVFVTYPTGRMEVVELEKPTVSIGAAAENDIVVRDDAAQSSHAQLLCDETGVQVLDLGTPTGTILNGTPLTPYLPEPLDDNARFSIGGVTLLYSIPVPDEPEVVDDAPQPRPSWFRRTSRAVSSYLRKNQAD